MVLNGEEGLECKVSLDKMRLEHVSESKYLECVLEESGTYDAECTRRLANWRKVACVIRSLVNYRGQ